MVGKIFITRSGYDPELGKHVKDPYLGKDPTMGACRPDIRKQLKVGDHIFVISGKLRGINQFVMGGFEIAQKINAVDAFRMFPEQRLRKLEDGQLAGNIIVDATGRQHKFDDHNSFDKRIQNYVIGSNLLSLTSPTEIAAGREQTLDALRDILHRNGKSPFEVVGHYGSLLGDRQIMELRNWLAALKKGAQN